MALTSSQADKYRGSYKKYTQNVKFTPPKTTPPKATAPKTTTAKTTTVTTDVRPSWIPTGDEVQETERPSWISTGNNYQGGSRKSYDTQIDTIDDYAEKLKNDRLASLRSAYDTQEASLSAQKPTIQQEAQDMRNLTDTSYYQSLPEMYRAMEAGGQRGGENITGMVGLNTVRGQGMNNANLYEQNNLRNIENALSTLGSQQISDEADILAGIDENAFSSKLQAMRDAASLVETQRQQEKSDYTNLIGAYSDNYLKEVNNLRSQGIPDTDYRIKALLAARNQKLQDEREAAYETSLNNEKNALAWARLNKSGSSGTNLTYEEALIRYNAGDRDTPVLSALGLL